MVDPHSIQPLKALVLEDDKTLVILKVSSNLAILDTKKASAIIKIKNVNSWVVGGHSLGGSVACIDVFKNSDSFEALFLLPLIL